MPSTPPSLWSEFKSFSLTISATFFENRSWRGMSITWSEAVAGGAGAAAKGSKLASSRRLVFLMCDENKMPRTTYLSEVPLRLMV
ncbi:hypothetical protein ACFX1W_045985 [Malus domestica]